MNRRGFLRGILALGVAPAVVGSDILMPVRPRLMTFEIGRIENFRFIQTLPLPEASGDTIIYRHWLPFGVGTIAWQDIYLRVEDCAESRLFHMKEGTSA